MQAGPHKAPARPGSHESLQSGSRLCGGLLASACALALLMGIAMLSVLAAPCMSQLGGLRKQHESQSVEQTCGLLEGAHRRLCDGYLAADGEEKWTAAAAWRQASPHTYACSGIEPHCLQKDMQQTNSSGSRSSCKPLPNSRRCSASHRCFHGYCGNRTSTIELRNHYNFEVERTAHINTSSRNADGSKSLAAAGQAADMILDPTHRILAEPATPNPAAGSPTAGPVASWPTLAVSIGVQNTSARRLPATFLATSHEYTRIVDYGDAQSIAAWAGIFNMLSSSPVIRIGGASQDSLTKVPGTDVWQALARLRASTNCKFVFGLPLWQQNALEMSKQIMNVTQKYFGDAVLGYELGNEPEFWPTGLGGYDTQGRWVSGFSAYADYFHRVAQALNPCSLGKKRLSGPGWGNVNTQPTSWWARIMWAGKDCYLAEANTHYYPYIDNSSVTASQLLSQPLQDVGLSKYAEYQRLANSAKLPLRISETNSLYGGGRAGLSDTFAGALWVADALFEFAKAGAVAFHLHWGIGGHPTAHLGSPNVGVQTNYYYTVNGTKMTHEQLEELNVNPAKFPPPVPYPSVHTPWYGYLFWTVAAHGDYGKTADTAFVPVNVSSTVSPSSWMPRVQQERAAIGCSANIKVHALKASNGDLRVAVINKDDSSGCNVQLQIPSAATSQAQQTFCKQASLGRLMTGAAGMFSKGGINWQGQTYDMAGFDGKIQGSRQLQLVQARRVDSTLCVYEVAVQATSAALLIIKQ